MGKLRLHPLSRVFAIRGFGWASPSSLPKVKTIFLEFPESLTLREFLTLKPPLVFLDNLKSVKKVKDDCYYIKSPLVEDPSVPISMSNRILVVRDQPIIPPLGDGMNFRYFDPFVVFPVRGERFLNSSDLVSFHQLVHSINFSELKFKWVLGYLFKVKYIACSLDPTLKKEFGRELLSNSYILTPLGSNCASHTPYKLKYVMGKKSAQRSLGYTLFSKLHMIFDYYMLFNFKHQNYDVEGYIFRMHPEMVKFNALKRILEFSFLIQDNFYVNYFGNSYILRFGFSNSILRNKIFLTPAISEPKEYGGESEFYEFEFETDGFLPVFIGNSLVWLGTF